MKGKPPFTFESSQQITDLFPRLMVSRVFASVSEGFPTCFSFVKCSFLNHNLTFSKGTCPGLMFGSELINRCV